MRHPTGEQMLGGEEADDGRDDVEWVKPRRSGSLRRALREIDRLATATLRDAARGGTASRRALQNARACMRSTLQTTPPTSPDHERGLGYDDAIVR